MDMEEGLAAAGGGAEEVENSAYLLEEEDWAEAGEGEAGEAQGWRGPAGMGGAAAGSRTASSQGWVAGEAEWGVAGKEVGRGRYHPEPEATAEEKAVGLEVKVTEAAATGMAVKAARRPREPGWEGAAQGWSR